jgi:hypothetical protein
MRAVVVSAICRVQVLKNFRLTMTAARAMIVGSRFPLRMIMEITKSHSKTRISANGCSRNS